MRQWDYTSNPRWLEARKGLLTATDIVGLIKPYQEWQNSATKSAAGDKRCNPASKQQEFHNACRKLWAEKFADWHGPNMDNAAMRRGHCLEKSCVNEVNEWRKANGLPEMYHWDDIVVKNGAWGCSPDALDVPMPIEAIDSCICDVSDIKPKHALEIKSFNDNDHMAEYELNDKWQIDAVRAKSSTNASIINQVAAQIISMDLDDCTVVFYNPAIPKYGIKMFTFYKSDFTAEALLFPQVVAAYEIEVAKFESLPASDVTIHTTERELYDQWYGGAENNGEQDSPF